MMQRMFKTNLYGFAVQPVRRGPAVFNAKLPIRAFARMTLDTSDSMIKHDMVHFKLSTNDHPLGITKPPKVIPKFWEDPMSHPVWSENEVNQVKTTHFLPSTTSDGLALIGVNMTQWVFNTFTFYRWRPYTEEKVLSRIILMETIAAIPGMTASMIRHLRSLRRMDEDHGWIHTLLEEAENERLHLLTFLKLRKPGRILKLSVVTAQVGFMNMYVLAYLMNQKMCHRFVGYLDEEAVKTYTEILQAIDSG